MKAVAVGSMIFALALGACGPSQQEIEKQQKTEAAAKLKKAREEAQLQARKDACDGAKTVSETFLHKSAELREAVASAHSSRISEAEAQYNRTLNNDAFTMTAFGVGLAIDIENRLKDAKIAALREEKAVVDAYAPLASFLEARAEGLEIASASGKSGDWSCADAKSSLDNSAKVVEKMRAATSHIERELKHEGDVIGAAQARLKAVGVL